MKSFRDQNYASNENLLSDWKARAEIASALDDSQESIERLREILREASRAQLGSSSVVLDIQETFANVLFHKKLYPWASKACAIAWKKRVERSGLSEFDVIKEQTTRLNLVKYLNVENLYQKALDVALAGGDDLLDTSINPVKISALAPLAEEFLRGNQNGHALRLYKIILHHESAAHDERHPSTIESRFGIARALYGLRRFDEARFNAIYNSHLLENFGDKDKARLEQHNRLIEKCASPSSNGQGNHRHNSTANSATIAPASAASRRQQVVDTEAGAEQEPRPIPPKKSWAAVAGGAKALPSPPVITKIPYLSGKSTSSHRQQNSASSQSLQPTHLRVPQAGSFKQSRGRPDRERGARQAQVPRERPQAQTQVPATSLQSTAFDHPFAGSAWSRASSITSSAGPSHGRNLGPSKIQASKNTGTQVRKPRLGVSITTPTSFAKSRETTLADSIEWSSPYDRNLPELENGELKQQSEDDKNQFNALLLRDLNISNVPLTHDVYSNLPSRSMEDTRSDINPLGSRESDLDDDEMSMTSLPPGNIGDTTRDSVSKIIAQTLHLATVGTSLLPDLSSKSDMKASHTAFNPPLRPRILTPSVGATFLSISPGTTGKIPASPQSPASQMENNDHGTWLDADDFDEDPRISKAADLWMYDTRKKAHEIVGQAVQSDGTVKVCVLDTGFDGKDPFLTDAPWGEKNAGSRIKGCIWFDQDGTMHTEEQPPSAVLAKDCPGYQDNHGHGTHCAGLILQLAPFAHIYIAKVISGPNGTPVADYVAKAIKHAVDEKSGWGIDILSISLGFEGNEPPEVDHVISNLHPRILLFAAAAANTAARNPNIAFPASIGKAICIKAADGNGHPSDRNPKNTFDAGKNFTALGQAVLSMTPMKDGWNGLRVLQKRMSGTSVATPVAATCAALVLEFIRQRDDARSNKLAQVRKAMRENMKDNMERIFMDLMTEKEGDFHFLVPHKLLKRHPDSDGKERDEVAHTIYACLKKL